MSDIAATISANPLFIVAHVVWWTLWVVFKVEPFPYGLLTLIVSLESITLSGLLLSSENREGESERKIARKDLSISQETNIMVEEIFETMRDIQEDVRVIKEDVGDK